MFDLSHNYLMWDIVTSPRNWTKNEENMNFKPITLEDKEWVTKYLKESAYEGCEFSFSTMLMWRDVYRTEVADLGDVLAYRGGSGKNRYVYAFPAGKGDKKEAIKKLMAFAKETGHRFVLRGFTKEWAEWLEEQFPEMFEIVACRDEWDYVYSVEKLSNLSGSKYHGKRNHIARFKDGGEWNYEKLTAGNVEECRAMSDEWYHAQLEIGNISVLKEKPVLNFALDHMEYLGLKGGVLYRDGKVVAFTIGESMSEELFHVHIEKAFSDIQGAYPMINQQFVLHEMQEHKYVNREEDDGIEGLRRAKESYYPEKMVEKYRAVLK